MMKKILVTAALLFLNNAYASSTYYSPYADLTINQHWDSQYQEMEPMDLFAVSKESGVKDYHLAFITDAGHCNPAWGAQPDFAVSKKWGTHLTDQLHNNKINYTVSFGGASGNDISLACSSDQLIKAYEQVIEAYHPNGLDFDIENGTADVNKIMDALAQVQQHYPDVKLSFTLPVLPEGLVSSGEDIVKNAKAHGLLFAVNIMAMDYGPAYTTKTMGQYAIDAAKQVYQFLDTLYEHKKSSTQLWNAIEVTPMIGVNDVNVEQFTLSDVDELIQFAKQNNLHAISMWSIARDKSCHDAWASPVCSGKDLQNNDYDYAKKFLASLV